MKLRWIEFENLRTGLHINRIKFNDDITLLVGLSGVGKTQILNAIEYSLKIAITNKIMLEPYAVKMCILINNDEYVWEYRIEQDNIEEIITERDIACVFTKEKLVKNGTEIIFSRDGEDVSVMGYERVPNPKKNESLLIQYSEDIFLKKFISEIKKLYPIEVEMDVRGAIPKEIFNRVKAKIITSLMDEKGKIFERYSQLPVPLKLYIAKTFFEDIYIEIFEAIKELFMEVSNIDIVEDPNIEAYVLAIEVYGKRLMQPEISNGMLKTIYYIVELITMSKDSLVLIDEFENGLGVNCIDILSEMLLGDRRDLQFIITSHHPKIINQVSSAKWKIIERDIAEVTNVSADEYGISHSQHDAYFNLINRWEYEGKI